MVERIGIIGLGFMGRPIAENLLKNGFPLTIYARKEQVKEEMKALGAEVARSPEAMAEQSDIILLVVTGVSAVRELLFGKNGIIKGAAEGTVVVDMTTSDPKFAEGFAKRLSEKGIEHLDAPISGGALGARDAQLLIIAGGKKEAFDRCMPVFKTISKKSIYMGKSGSGHLVKVIHNQLGFATFMANCEAVVLGEKLGLSIESMTEVFNNGNARSYSTEVRFPKFIIPKTFDFGSTIATVFKDISISRELESRAGMSLPINECTYNYLKHAVDIGAEKEDWSKVLLKIRAQLNK